MVASLARETGLNPTSTVVQFGWKMSKRTEFDMQKQALARLKTHASKPVQAASES